MMYEHGVLPKVDKRNHSLEPLGRGEIKIVKAKDLDNSINQAAIEE